MLSSTLFDPDKSTSKLLGSDLFVIVHCLSWPEEGNTDNSGEGNDQENGDTENSEDNDKENDNPLEDTDIDPDDEEYNTGRDEIPDTVETEWERKIGKKKKKKKPTTPENPTPTEEYVPEEVVYEQPVTTVELPKTGNEYEDAIKFGGLSGLVIAALIGLSYTNSMYNISNGEKVVSSRKKFKRRNKNRRLK